MESRDTESMEELLARHHLETKELQAKVQQLKHGVSKGDKKKKKEVTGQVAILEAELDEKHEQELKKFQSSVPTNVDNLSEKLNCVCIENNSEEIANVAVADESGCVKKLNKNQRRKEKQSKLQAEREERIRNQDVLNLTGSRNVESEKIKKILVSRDLAVSEVPPDGNCLYSAVEDQLRRNGVETSVGSLRQQAAGYMREHIDDFLPFLVKDTTGELYTAEEFDDYCRRVETTTEWGGQAEIRALSDVLRRPIEVIQAVGPSIVVGETCGARALTLLYYRHAFGLGEHYNSVMATD